MRALYICSYPSCGKSYVNNSILKRHIQAFHNTEKRFQCSFCGKCLASRQNLKEHTYTHTGEKPYTCSAPGCGASFRQGTHLSAHKRNEHPNPEDQIQRTINFQNLIDLSLLTRLINKLPIKEDEPVYESNVKIMLSPIKEPYNCKVPNVFQSI